MAWSALCAPAALSESKTSSTSWVSTHRTTSAMVRPDVAAPSSMGANSLAAVAYQKSPSLNAPGDDRATSVNDAAVRRAPCHVSDACSGDHDAAARPVEAEGS